MKKLLALILALTMALALVACGNNNNAGPSGSSSGNGGNEQQQPGNGGIAEAVTLQIQDPDTLAPFSASGGGGGPVKHAIFQALGARDGFAGEFKKIMIDTYERTGDRTYSVTIFDNIFDSEGNHITADDVVFSWEECHRVGELTDTFVVESVKKTGDYSVEFTWADEIPVGSFESTVGIVFIVSKAAYEASSDGMAMAPVGTGPYKVDKFVTSSSVNLVANENYWEPEEMRDLATEQQNVKAINFQVLSESSAITMALQTNAVDVSAEVNNQDLPNFREGGAYSSDYTVQSQPKSSGMVLCMNNSENSPLHDLNLRMAVSYAIDADFIAQTINGGNNTINYVMGGPTYLDYDGYFEEIYHNHDLDKAKEYMANSEYADGVDLKLIFMAGNPQLEDTGVVLQSQLKQIGINLTPEAQQFGNYLANEGDPTQWDFTICTFGSNDYLTNAWKKYFDANATGSGTTKNFVDDNKLQELLAACTGEEGHTADNIHAFWKYVTDNAWIHGLIVENDNVVYNKNLISGIAWDDLGALAPGGFTYVG